MGSATPTPLSIPDPLPLLHPLPPIQAFRTALRAFSSMLMPLMPLCGPSMVLPIILRIPPGIHPHVSPPGGIARLALPPLAPRLLLARHGGVVGSKEALCSGRVVGVVTLAHGARAGLVRARSGVTHWSGSGGRVVRAVRRVAHIGHTRPRAHDIWRRHIRPGIARARTEARPGRRRCGVGRVGRAAG